MTTSNSDTGTRQTVTRKRSRREREIARFLDEAGWGRATPEDLPGDASARSYRRLQQTGEGDPQTALLLMEPAKRVRSSYAEAARLADGDVLAVAALGQQLVQRGFSAPRVLAGDVEAGLLLIEDFGDELYARVLERDPDREAELYGRAVDFLGALYRSTFTDRAGWQGREWRIGSYSTDVLLTEVALLLDWYAPDQGWQVTDAARASWEVAWRDALEALDAHAPGLVLRDFHAENLFALDARDFEATVGVIDYQDALFGHPAYDLASLLEDARRDVDPELVPRLIERFCHRARVPDGPAFRAAYAVIGAQRAAKILGIFVRLSERDGKPRYRTLLPRVEAHFHRALAHEAMTPVREWWEAHAVPAATPA